MVSFKIKIKKLIVMKNQILWLNAHLTPYVHCDYYFLMKIRIHRDSSWVAYPTKEPSWAPFFAWCTPPDGTAGTTNSFFVFSSHSDQPNEMYS